MGKTTVMTSRKSKSTRCAKSFTRQPASANQATDLRRALLTMTTTTTRSATRSLSAISSAPSRLDTTTRRERLLSREDAPPLEEDPAPVEDRSSPLPSSSLEVLDLPVMLPCCTLSLPRAPRLTSADREVPWPKFSYEASIHLVE